MTAVSVGSGDWLNVGFGSGRDSSGNFYSTNTWYDFRAVGDNTWWLLQRTFSNGPAHVTSPNFDIWEVFVDPSTLAVSSYQLCLHDLTALGSPSGTTGTPSGNGLQIAPWDADNAVVLFAGKTPATAGPEPVGIAKINVRTNVLSAFTTLMNGTYDSSNPFGTSRNDVFNVAMEPIGGGKLVVCVLHMRGTNGLSGGLENRATFYLIDASGAAPVLVNQYSQVLPMPSGSVNWRLSSAHSSDGRAFFYVGASTAGGGVFSNALVITPGFLSVGLVPVTWDFQLPRADQQGDEIWIADAGGRSGSTNYGGAKRFYHNGSVYSIDPSAFFGAVPDPYETTGTVGASVGTDGLGLVHVVGDPDPGRVADFSWLKVDGSTLSHRFPSAPFDASVIRKGPDAAVWTYPALDVSDGRNQWALDNPIVHAGIGSNVGLVACWHYWTDRVNTPNTFVIRIWLQAVKVVPSVGFQLRVGSIAIN